ncbi:hypothetical protein AURDEDRAFT_169570 [Auricularia subglabra TFB-10046 SS5]|uniref:Uncharacterized protein n=1 Tax=Auricularia subglabra (strain TFB-10046 / SS5) TaxID=717982 RepID=J0LKB6_AURST|nr:hypothetical protein AURDEDRAFT_169570 [Auricularia subglabra TFB-10046 SS5]
MPAHRKQKPFRCAFATPEPVVTKPRAPRRVLSAEEKAANALMRERKKEWEATLVPAPENERFRWPKGTVAMFPSDAKKAFKLTPREIDTLKREHVQNSFKSFVRLADVEDLARRKHIALAGSPDDYTPPPSWSLLTHTRINDDAHRYQTNWGIHRAQRIRW